MDDWNMSAGEMISQMPKANCNLQPENRRIGFIPETRQKPIYVIIGQA
jgi:hypothetical protein